MRIHLKRVDRGALPSCFAQEHNIDESTFKKIIDLSEGKIENYKIPVITLLKICEARKVTLSDFFEKVGL